LSRSGPIREQWVKFGGHPSYKATAPSLFLIELKIEKHRKIKIIRNNVRRHSKYNKASTQLNNKK
jgi:hypothetical protein